MGTRERRPIVYYKPQPISGFGYSEQKKQIARGRGVVRLAGQGATVQRAQRVEACGSLMLAGFGNSFQSLGSASGASDMLDIEVVFASILAVSQ